MNPPAGTRRVEARSHATDFDTAVGDARAERRAAIELLEGARTVTVLCHRQPDPDTVGSGLALAIVLADRGVDVRVSFDGPGGVPEAMRLMPGIEYLVPADAVHHHADLVVAVDCGGRERLGSLVGCLDRADSSLVIDHHLSNTRFGTVNVVDPTAVSTTAVLADLFDDWGVTIGAELAKPLYAGLVADTGSFKWATAESHLLAHRLLATGIDGTTITRELLDTHPFGWLPMLSSVLKSARLLPYVGGYGLVYAVVTLDDARDLRPAEVESVVDIVRTVGDAEVAAVLKQSVDGWSVSLRSRSRVDVSRIAVELGGGGHRHAAGYSCTGDVTEVLRALVARMV